MRTPNASLTRRVSALRKKSTPGTQPSSTSAASGRQSERSRERLSRAALGVIVLLSGLLCGLYGVGALLGAYVSRVTRDSHAFRANLCFVFLAENLFRVGLYAACGLLTRGALLRALALYPFMLAGLFLGMRSAGVIAERTARRLVIALLLVSGVSLIGACL